MPDEPTRYALQRATELCNLQRYDEAITAMTTVLAHDPDVADAWCVLARAHLGADNPQAALAAAQRAIALEPDGEWPHRLASVALSELGFHPQALDEALAAVRAEPFAWQPHTRVAATSAEVDMLDQAKAASDRAIELAPNEAETWLCAGSVARARKDRAAAETSYLRALALDPQNSAAHNELARLRMSRRGIANPVALAAATTGFARAISVDPRSKVSRDNFEIAIRNFLNRTAYFVFLLCYLLARLTSSHDSPIARAVPVILLVLPGMFVALFVTGLTSPVRALLVRTLHSRYIAVATAAEIVAVLALLASAVLPEHLRVGAAACAAFAAVVARVVLLIDLRLAFPHAFRRYPARNRRAGWFLVGCFAVTGLILFLAGAVAPTVAGTVFLAAALVIAWLLRRNRTRGSVPS